MAKKITTPITLNPEIKRDFLNRCAAFGISQEDLDRREEDRRKLLTSINEQVAPAISTDLDKVGQIIDMFADKTMQCLNNDEHKNCNMYANTLLSYVKFRASTVGIGEGKPVKEYADHLQEALALLQAAGNKQIDPADFQLPNIIKDN